MYISRAERPKLDPIIDGLVNTLRTKVHPNRTLMRDIVAALVMSALDVSHVSSFYDAVSTCLRQLSMRINTRGQASYCVCRVVLETLKPDTGWCYESLSGALLVIESACDLIYMNDEFQQTEGAYNCIAVLCDTATEIERRLMAIYNNVAIAFNGDMECFSETFSNDFTDPEGGLCGSECRCKEKKERQSE